MIPLQLGKILYKVTQGLEGKKREEAIELFIEFVKKQQLLSKMEYIIEAFEIYAKEQTGIVSLHITSARKIGTELQEKIATQFGDDAEITTSLDETLIGGVVLRAGNTILDGSVKKQLSKMKSNI